MDKRNTNGRDAQARRMAMKRQSARMLTEAMAGAGLSKWEAEALVQSIEEVYFSDPELAPVRDGEMRYSCVCANEGAGKPLERCRKVSVTLTLLDPEDKKELAGLREKGGMSAEVRQRRIVRIVEQAREQAERERDEARARGEQPPPEPQPAEPGRSRFRVPNPAQGLLGLLRNTAPIQMSYSVRKSSAYGRLRQEAPFWYRVGLSPALDIADSLYAVSSLNDRQTMSLSTSIKVMRQVSADVKFAKTTSERDQAGLVQGNYQQDWPDLRVAVTGLERWSVFGGGGEQGWFRSSNVDVAFKRSRVANGFTSTLYNPRTTTSISPRWNVTFHSGMSAALNLGLSEDVSVINGTRNEAERLNIGLQVRHSFRAERLLARLNLYRPGSTPTINMDVDVSYARDTNQRRLPQSSVADAQTGQSRLSVNPRFSYQVTRNLSGAVRFIFTRQKVFESDIVNKTFGLGMEATFVF